MKHYFKNLPYLQLWVTPWAEGPIQSILTATVAAHQFENWPTLLTAHFERLTQHMTGLGPAPPSPGCAESPRQH